MAIEYLSNIIIILLCIYALKDWSIGLCGLILMMAVLRSGYMPRSMYGIQGLNPWNILLVVTSLSWLVNRGSEGLRWDMPRNIRVLFLMYLTVIVVGVLRIILDSSFLQSYLFTEIISDRLIDTIKWVLPGILLFDGCRTRRRLVVVLVSLVSVYFLIAAQIIIRSPIKSAFTILDDDRNEICQSIGYSSCDMSIIMAGASFATLAMIPLVRQKKYKVLIVGVACMIAFGQMLTGGRGGYFAWGCTGLVMCLLKWRKYLILAPIIVILPIIAFPGITERAFAGFGETDVTGQNITDEYTVTSGRSLAWPLVIDKISKSLLFGYGRRAMERTGIAAFLSTQLDEGFLHPHSMYLETLLDNGILGSIPILLFWTVMVVYSGRLFRSDNRYCSATGGLALALILAQLFGGIGAQHFYPKEGTLALWTAMFLSLRVYVEENRVKEGAINAENY